jgi:three-Cys-motif partner protein
MFYICSILRRGADIMPQRAFGGAHTKEKLDRLEAYLKAYLSVFKNQSWVRTIYFDAFAGTGEIPGSKESDPLLPLDDRGKGFIVGSARRALGLKNSFSEYVFVEKRHAKVKELERLKAEHSFKADRIRIVHQDANSALQAFCAERDWKKCRAVVFLDPFGNQVEWATIQVIARTKAVDLWYLFPAGLGVHRQVGKDGTVHYTHAPSLDRIFGTSEWRQAFLGDEEGMPDLFQQQERQAKKLVTPASATQFMIKRMKSVFAGGVLDEWLQLGPRGHHSYSLVFAWANPSPGAAKAGKIAKAVLRSGARGGAKRH